MACFKKIISNKTSAFETCTVSDLCPCFHGNYFVSFVYILKENFAHFQRQLGFLSSQQNFLKKAKKSDMKTKYFSILKRFIMISMPWTTSIGLTILLCLLGGRGLDDIINVYMMHKLEKIIEIRKFVRYRSPSNNC